MENFVSAVKNLFFKEKGIDVANVDYMEMPSEKERYNLSKVIGNANLTKGRYKTKSEADAIIDEFLSMPLP